MATDLTRILVRRLNKNLYIDDTYLTILYNNLLYAEGIQMNTWQNSKRRSKLCIIAEILEIAKEGTLKTQVMYKASLSFVQLNEYIKFMLKIGLIEKVAIGGKDVYTATQKGLDFLQRQYELAEMMKTETGNTSNSTDMLLAEIPPNKRPRK